MSDKKLLFLLKFIFRFIHVFSYAIVFGNVCYDIFIKERITGTDNKKGIYLSLNILFYILIIISGLVNMILLIIEKKFTKDFYYEVWKKSLIVKFFLSLFVTPLLEALISIGIKENDEVNRIAIPIKFSLMLIFTLWSNFLRYFREYYMTSTVEGYIQYLFLI